MKPPRKIKKQKSIILETNPLLGLSNIILPNVWGSVISISMTDQYTYPVRVKATDCEGREVVLVRLGGGERMRWADPDYYPTILWYVEKSPRLRFFDPTIKGYSWGTRGPDFSGPYTLVETLDTNTSDDPLKAITRGFAAL